MSINIVQLSSAKEVTRTAATIISNKISSERHCVLGLATGKTFLPIYQKLVEMYENGEISFKNVTTFNLDEYVGLGPGSSASFSHYMHRALFDSVDIEVGGFNLLHGAAECPPKEAIHYDKQVVRRGPIDLQLLGVGLNGHIGFNEPGSPHNSRTRVVELCPSTIAANKGDLAGLDVLPSHAITMGIGTILEAKSILVVATGSAKADAIQRLVNGPVSESFPASALRNHRDVTLLVDGAASSKCKP